MPAQIADASAGQPQTPYRWEVQQIKTLDQRLRACNLARATVACGFDGFASACSSGA